MMERYKLKTMLLSDEDVRVFLETLEHAADREDISDEDRARVKSLRERLNEQFEASKPR